MTLRNVLELILADEEYCGSISIMTSKDDDDSNEGYSVVENFDPYLYRVLSDEFLNGSKVERVEITEDKNNKFIIYVDKTCGW